MINNHLKILLLCICTISLHFITLAQNGPYLINSSQLKINLEKIKTNDTNYQKAYKSLLSEAGKALKFGPVSVMEKINIPPSGSKHDYMSLAPYHWPDPSKKDGLPYMRKDGETNPEVKLYKDKDYLPELCSHIYILALAHYYSGEKQYYNHAIQLISVWFLDTATKMNPNMNFGQAIKGENVGRGAGLIDARHFIKVMEAIELMNREGAYPKEDLKNMQAWFAEFLYWMQTSKNGVDEMKAKNNHGVWYDALRLSISLFNGQKEDANKIIQNAQLRLANQMDDNNRFPLEMARTTSLHYSVFVIDAFLKIAKMGEATGVNFWDPALNAKHTLKGAVEEMIPYLVEEKKWDGPQIKAFDFKEGMDILNLASSKFSCGNCKTYLDENYRFKNYNLLIFDTQ
jgi:hypothetical protein